MYDTIIQPQFVTGEAWQHFLAGAFPIIHPVHWLHSHFAVGGWSPLQRLSGMITAHMTRIAPRSGFTWHPHRGLEIYTWVLEGQLYHEDTTGGRGEIVAGELQRMFSGDWIEHQELNLWHEPVRVIQIWYAADPRYRGLPPHYQQTGQPALPARRAGEATVYALIGDGSPMEQHMAGRLAATSVDPGGRTEIERPRPGEDLFLYVTDGAGHFQHNGQPQPVGQYDVILARPDAPPATLAAAPGQALDFLSFYLPSFLA
ncbi:MAG: pirin family protein [Chloroflexi bacterium]|nr:pirin family protein [Chloroflexota bacterium]MCI0650055.1 pirin family protein [Chloroflexota bacterium]MCI0726527.1 pirin family protein [Chloroflexota bacterium]